MKVNFGCGKKALPGFCNIDAVARPGVDLVHAIDFNPDGSIANPIPLEDGCADEFRALHVVEHFYRWQADALVQEWARLLKPGGLFVLELPNIEAAARNLLAGMNDQFAMWPLYGDWSHRDPYMMHRHGYSPATIHGLLADCGLRNIAIKPPQTHGAKVNRDMRVEAVK